MISFASCTIITFVLLSLTTFTHARDDAVFCGACHMLVDELIHEISQTDPQKSIQTGSFRINPDGSQSLKEIPYARSEVHLTELFDEVCKASTNYLQTTAEDTGRKIFTRQNRRDNAPNQVKNVVISSDNNKMLQFACESIIEDFEDELITVFKNPDDNYLKSVCVDAAEVCTEEQLYDVNTVATEITKAHENLAKPEDESKESDENGNTADSNSSEQEEERKDEL